MVSPVYLSLAAAVAFALSSLCTKFASKHTIPNQWVLLFYYYLTLLPFILLLPFFVPIHIPTSAAWPYIAGYAAVFFVGNALSIAAMYRVDVSTFAAFFQLRSAFVVLLAYLFLAERFPSSHYLAMALMLLGAILVCFNERQRLNAFLQVSTLLIILQQAVHAVAHLIAGAAVHHVDSLSFVVWGNSVSAAGILVLLPVLGRQLRVRLAQVTPLVASGFFAIAGSAALFTAFQSNVSVSSILSLLTSPLVLVLTFIASRAKPELLEHHPYHVYVVRAFGVAALLLGALYVSQR